MNNNSDIKSSPVKKREFNVISIKNTQEILHTKSKEIIKGINSHIGPESNEVDAEQFRNVMSIFAREVGLKDNVVRIIESYLVTHKKSNGQVSDESYCNFMSGKEMKTLIFDKNAEEKRKRIEELSNVYVLMGGTNDGISKENLNRCISQTMFLYTEPERFKGTETEKSKFNHEAEEIINLLGRDKADRLTFEDFINAMTSEFSSNFDDFALDLIK